MHTCGTRVVTEKYGSGKIIGARQVPMCKEIVTYIILLDKPFHDEFGLQSAVVLVDEFTVVNTLN